MGLLFMHKKIYIMLFVTALLTTADLGAQTGGDDAVLKAMQMELARSQAKLQLHDMQRPYFIEYRLEDISEFSASAEYGALIHQGQTHQRFLRVSVRIGDYKSDNSGSRGAGSAAIAASDNDVTALRYALWATTDEAYKDALHAYSAKQAALKGYQTPPTADDFSSAKAVTQIDPLVKLDLNTAEWTRRVEEASGLFATDAAVCSFAQQIQYSTSSMQATAINRYIVNTDATAVRHGYTTYSASVGAGTQAADGMRLDRSYTTTAVSEKQLDDWAAFKKHTVDILLTLRDLRLAPVVGDDYHGPVLFSGDAAAGVIDFLFVPNIEADRPEMGTTARTQGAYKASYKSRVLPDFIDVVDDPLMTSFEGKGLVGAYSVDDEGVPAQKVQIVSKGILDNYLIGREPVKDFPVSNGHGRAPLAQAAHARAGVLVVKSLDPVSVADLNAKLLQMAKDQGRDFVYMVETLGARLTPRLLYRVNASGTRELVRGVVFEELDQRSLRSDIVAAGDDAYVSNLASGVPETTIAPSLLFGDVGVKRATQEHEKLPYYPPPAIK